MIHVIHMIACIFRSLKRLLHHCRQCGINGFGLGEQPVACLVEQQFTHHLSIQNLHFRHVVLPVDVQDTGIGEVCLQERFDAFHRSSGDIVAIVIIVVSIHQFLHQHAVFRVIQIYFRLYAVHFVFHFDHVDLFRAVALHTFHLVDGPSGVFARPEGSLHFFRQLLKEDFAVCCHIPSASIVEPSGIFACGRRSRQIEVRHHIVSFHSPLHVGGMRIAFEQCSPHLGAHLVIFRISGGRNIVVAATPHTDSHTSDGKHFSFHSHHTFYCFYYITKLPDKSGKNLEKHRKAEEITDKRGWEEQNLEEWMPHRSKGMP